MADDLKKKEQEAAEKATQVDDVQDKPNSGSNLGGDPSTWSPEDMRRYNTHPHETIGQEQNETLDEEKKFKEEFDHPDEKDDSIHYYPNKDWDKKIKWKDDVPVEPPVTPINDTTPEVPTDPIDDGKNTSSDSNHTEQPTVPVGPEKPID